MSNTSRVKHKSESLDTKPEIKDFVLNVDKSFGNSISAVESTALMNFKEVLIQFINTNYYLNLLSTKYISNLVVRSVQVQVKDYLHKRFYKLTIAVSCMYIGSP